MAGDASLTGAELFEIEADFSAKIVTFRLVGGMHPPHPPPNPPLHVLPLKALQNLYYSLIHPHLRYGIFLWGNTDKTYT